jgi:hypothetical protein
MNSTIELHLVPAGRVVPASVFVGNALPVEKSCGAAKSAMNGPDAPGRTWVRDAVSGCGMVAGIIVVAVAAG